MTLLFLCRCLHPRIWEFCKRYVVTNSQICKLYTFFVYHFLVWAILVSIWKFQFRYFPSFYLSLSNIEESNRVVLINFWDNWIFVDVQTSMSWNNICGMLVYLLLFFVPGSKEHLDSPSSLHLCCDRNSSLWSLQTLILTLMLLVANLANTKWCKTLERWLKPWHMGTHLRALTAGAIQWIPTWHGFDGFQKSLHPCALDESSLSIGRVKLTSTGMSKDNWSATIKLLQ